MGPCRELSRTVLLSSVFLSFCVADERKSRDRASRTVSCSQHPDSIVLDTQAFLCARASIEGKHIASTTQCQLTRRDYLRPSSPSSRRCFSSPSSALSRTE